MKRKVIELDWKIPLFKIYSDKADIAAVSKVIKRGSYWAEGPEIGEFENVLKRFAGTEHALAFGSGTSALHAALLAYGVQGKEVIVPSFTFIATANAAVLAGAKPVFADIERETCGLDASDVESKITKNTAAIVPMHYGGTIARDIEKLREIAAENSILLIEDAAESLGAKRNGKMAGTFGNAGIYSFCQNKVITTGEGGAIVTNSNEITERLKLLRSHGRIEKGSGYFSSVQAEDYIEAGYNYRLSSILAALGLSQLKKINKIIGMRRKNAQYYNKKLRIIHGLRTPQEQEGTFNIYQMYTIEVENAEKRNALQEYLAKHGIMTKVYFSAAHLKTFYRKNFNCREGMLPVTEELQGKVLTLPFYPHISKTEMDFVAEKIKNFFKEG